MISVLMHISFLITKATEEKAISPKARVTCYIRTILKFLLVTIIGAFWSCRNQSTNYNMTIWSSFASAAVAWKEQRWILVQIVCDIKTSSAIEHNWGKSSFLLDKRATYISGNLCFPQCLGGCYRRWTHHFYLPEPRCLVKPIQAAGADPGQRRGAGRSVGP